MVGDWSTRNRISRSCSQHRRKSSWTMQWAFSGPFSTTWSHRSVYSITVVYSITNTAMVFKDVSLIVSRSFVFYSKLCIIYFVTYFSLKKLTISLYWRLVWRKCRSHPRATGWLLYTAVDQSEYGIFLV